MWPIVLIVIYSVLIVLASLAGGLLPSWIRLTHARMQLMMSLVGGLMLGVGIFHMLPHAVESAGVTRAVFWLMIGLLSTFFLIRTFHFHHHAPVEEAHDSSAQTSDDHEHVHQHAKQTHDSDSDHNHHAHKLSWVGVFVGLALHTAIDGVALAASVKDQAGHATGGYLFGLATFLAIVLHKPLDAMSITSLMAAARWSVTARQFVNAGFAMMCPLGAAVFLSSVEGFGDEAPAFVGCALGFSAGVFLCISLADLLPEVQFHSHDKIKLSLAMLLGIAAAYGIEHLPGHTHDHSIEKPGDDENQSASSNGGDQSDRCTGRMQKSPPVAAGGVHTPTPRRTKPLYEPHGTRSVGFI